MVYMDKEKLWIQIMKEMKELNEMKKLNIISKPYRIRRKSFFFTRFIPLKPP